MNIPQQDMLRRFSENVYAVGSTHGLNFNDFLLTNVLVIDDWGDGLFVAKQRGHIKLQKKIEQIKNNVGCIKTFMTDITNVFYKAWVEVMGPVTNQIFCA